MSGERGARGQGGYTLIEMMIAVACLGILATGLTTTAGARRKVLGAATQKRHATAALEAELERLRSARALPSNGSFTNSELARLREARAERSVKLLSSGLARVELSLRWRDARERTQKVKLVTLLAGAKR